MSIQLATKSSSSSSTSSSSRSSKPFQLKLSNPPAGRRQMNGNTNTSDTPSPKTSSSEIYLPPTQLSSSSNESTKMESPPPIPPRSSLLNATNKRVEGQFVRAGETPIKTKRTIFRSRNVKRREPTAAKTQSTHIRSDSADALSVHSPRSRRRRNPTHCLQVEVDKETNSD